MQRLLNRNNEELYGRIEGLENQLKHNDDKGDKGDDWDDEFRMKMKKKQGEVQNKELERYLEDDVEDDAIPFVPETPNNRRPQGQPTFPFQFGGKNDWNFREMILNASMYQSCTVAIGSLSSIYQT